MEVNIEDYLSEEEMRAVVVSEYRSLVRSKMKDESDLKRILSNAAFETYYDIVDECFDGVSKDVIKTQIDGIMGDPSSYNIFKKPDAWDREPNAAYKYLQEVVTNNKPMVAKIISELLKEQTVKACKQDVKELVQDVLIDHIRQF